MVRKVGFEDGSSRKSVADRVLDEHRAKARARRAAEAEAKAEARNRPASATTGGGVARGFKIVFLLVWLTLWTGGVLMVAFVILSGEVHAGPLIFMLIWEAFAIFAWVAVVRSLLRLVRGQ